MQVALAFSLPVFISPPGVKRDLQCGLERVAADTVRATVRIVAAMLRNTSVNAESCERAASDSTPEAMTPL